MADLTERLQAAAAATAAIRDVSPAIEQAGPKLHTLTIELEVGTKGQLVGAVAWVQHRVSLAKVLGVGRG